MKKCIYIISGITALALGVVGIILPVLPTTPLLLLSWFCFNKSSERVSLWFRGTVLYKRCLAEYIQRKSLTLKQKISIQVFAGTMMVFSFITLNNWILRVIIIAVFITHNYFFIFRIKTYTSEKQAKRNITEVKNES